MPKDVGLRIRVERELRGDFVRTCRHEGKTAAQVLREYMREYVRQHEDSIQHDLFYAGQRQTYRG